MAILFWGDRVVPVTTQVQDEKSISDRLWTRVAKDEGVRERAVFRGIRAASKL